MKDAITLLAVVAAALAVTRLLASRRTLEAVAGVLGLAVALVFIVRLRLYIGRMLLAATVVAGAAGAVTAIVRGAALWPRLTKSLLAAAVVAIGLNLITAPDAKSVLALHYGGWLTRPQNTAPVATNPDTATPVVPSPAADLGGPPHRLIARLAAMVRAFSPDELVAFRQRFALTGGNSVASSERVSGWTDLLALAPRALFDAVLSPYPWDVVRPRGITGPFRTLAVLEPMLTLLLLPAIVLGLSRVRRTEEWLIAVFAVGGLFTMGLVFPNLGTMFRLRVPFVMLLVGFSAIGFDAYQRVASVISDVRAAARPDL